MGRIRRGEREGDLAEWPSLKADKSEPAPRFDKGDKTGPNEDGTADIPFPDGVFLFLIGSLRRR